MSTKRQPIRGGVHASRLQSGLQSLYLDIAVTATARFVSFQRYITHDCQSYSFQLTADTKRTILDEYDALELHISSLLSISDISQY